MFKEMLPSTGNGFIRHHHRKIELCSNKLTNEGLALIKDYTMSSLMFSSKLEYLSLFNNDLQGMAAADMVRDLVNHLPHATTIDLQGNLIY